MVVCNVSVMDGIETAMVFNEAVMDRDVAVASCSEAATDSVVASVNGDALG